MNRPASTVLGLCLLLAGAAPAASAPAARPEAPAVKVEYGDIKGAAFAIASGPAWNRRLLLIAHGYRPDSAPLIPDLHPEHAALKALLDEGWMVATTSYRRNGLVVADAVDDLDALRAYIAEAYGDPERVILEGESLGGLIITIMAERDKGPYQGAVAFDATLYVKETDAKVGLSLLPRIPLLFVATEREAVQPQRYLTSLIARPDPVVQPELFLIRREGHTNINQPEHLAAVRALNDWIDRGRGALPQPPQNQPYFDATVPPDPGPSNAIPLRGGPGFESDVAEVDAVYGNMLLEAQAADFASAGIEPMTFFEFSVNDVPCRALYARTYSDVKVGQWVAFPDADGRTVLAQNLGNAASTTGLKAGDPVVIRPLAPKAPALR
jgi:pimeloyl-ACP methyl ester carboxylesterase